MATPNDSVSHEPKSGDINPMPQDTMGYVSHDTMGDMPHDTMADMPHGLGLPKVNSDGSDVGSLKYKKN